jgi:transcriptional regulator with XRE-family HTH domain
MNRKGKRRSDNKSLDSDEYLKRLGKRIKELRIKQGYSNYEHFAYDHNISRAQFGRYEQGQDLRFSSLVKIVNAFEITLEEFFSEGFES